MILALGAALGASLAIVVLDHTPLRSAPRSGSQELTALWQGDVLEIRGDEPDYLQVYDPRRERGGYVKSDRVQRVELTEDHAPELLAVLRFLKDTPGSEALGISYGAAYLRAAPARALTAEPFDAIGRMAERLAERASGAAPSANLAAHLEVIDQFGVHMRSLERAGGMHLCYDGELFRRVLATPGAGADELAHAVLALTRPDCIDPALGPALRSALDEERATLLDRVGTRDLPASLAARMHARRAAVWAAIAYERARRGGEPLAAAQRALAELVAVRVHDLGESHRGEYEEALLHASAVRWAASPPATIPAPQPGALRLSATAGAPGETCLTLDGPHSSSSPAAALLRRCTYGIVWMASARTIPQGPALTVAVQPLEGWCELWVFHRRAGVWAIEVLSPGGDEPEAGYVEYAGYVPASRRLLIAREVMSRGRRKREFQELRLDDLTLVRRAGTPQLLRDFGRWQDAAWRTGTLALR
jgi:hypothetical protein